VSATVDAQQECYLLEVYRAEVDDMAARGGGSFSIEVHVGPAGQVTLGNVTRVNRVKPWRATAGGKL
jgi:hypothetical protein